MYVLFVFCFVLFFIFLFFLYNVIVTQILVTYVGSWFFLVFQGQKSLALDTAIRMWQLLFAESSGHWLNTGASSYR